MLVGKLEVEVYIPWATSLKDKRQVLKSMVQKSKNRFNISIAELNNEDLWQRATIGVAIVGDNQEYLQRQLQLLINFFDAEQRWEVINIEVDWI